MASRDASSLKENIVRFLLRNMCDYGSHIGGNNIRQCYLTVPYTVFYQLFDQWGMFIRKPNSAFYGNIRYTSKEGLDLCVEPTFFTVTNSPRIEYDYGSKDECIQSSRWGIRWDILEYHLHMDIENTAFHGRQKNYNDE